MGRRELDSAYEQCRRITRAEAKNFYYAFITLPANKRRAIYASYAFCRLCDDATDDVLPLQEKLQRLRETEEQLQLAYQGQPPGPLFTALAHAASQYHIPQEYFQEVLRGVEMDLTVTRYRTFEELRTYCYRVASAVGLICLEVFGYRDPEAKEHAVDLGLAMQLTNILRDVREDLERDRIYLPQEEMEQFGYSEEELRQGVVNQAFLELMHFQAQRARRYFDSGLRCLPFLSWRARACPAVLGGIYQRILDRLEASQFNVFDGRLSLSSREKLFLTARLWLQSFNPVSLIPHGS
ncbi:MAG: presqualene diphosphate synthase HpnD [Dehalococcoidia bacterium]